MRKLLIVIWGMCLACNPSANTISELSPNNIYKTNKWERKEIFINEPSDFFSYDIVWTTHDTSICFHVLSKYMDSCVPIYLVSVSIKASNREVVLSFGEYDTLNLKRLTPLDLNSIEFGTEMSLSLITDLEKEQIETMNGNIHNKYSFFFDERDKVKEVYLQFIKDNNLSNKFLKE